MKCHVRILTEIPGPAGKSTSKSTQKSHSMKFHVRGDAETPLHESISLTIMRKSAAVMMVMADKGEKMDRTIHQKMFGAKGRPGKKGIIP